ncbi:MAG TPA: hypothetical protein VFC58_13015 [Desulfosporosinus sp.]|nr:hypothetical protein [Desulfosporosinus sp.]
MNRLKKHLGAASVLLFSTVLLVGGAFGVSSALAHSAAAEEGKVISNKTMISTPNIGKEAGTSIQKTPGYTFVDPDKPVPKDWPTPAAKDISKEKAASYASDKIVQMYGDKLDGGNATVMFSKSKSQGNIILKDMWQMFFHTADGKKTYFCNVDSVTGEVYSITLTDESKELRFGVEPEQMTPEQKQTQREADAKLVAQRDATRNDNRFIEVAKDIVSAHLLNGQTVVSSKFNAYGGVNSSLWLYVDVSLSDGSGYQIYLDAFTRELIGYGFRPDGV